MLFITKLLAETALEGGHSVMISETHGMAQRGGNVVSHLKVGSFSSPLIRPGRADILLALHPDGLAAHGFYLREGGKRFCNRPHPESETDLDATEIAAKLGSPVSANLVLIGFAVGSGSLFCKTEQVEQVLSRYGGKRQAISLKAFEAGWKHRVRQTG